MKPVKELTDEELRKAIENFTPTETELDRQRKQHGKVDLYKDIRQQCIKELTSRQ